MKIVQVQHILSQIRAQKNFFSTVPVGTGWAISTCHVFIWQKKILDAFFYYFFIVYFSSFHINLTNLFFVNVRFSSQNVFTSFNLH